MPILSRVILFFVLSVSIAFAQELYRPVPGAIPLQYGGYPATDLVLNDRVLLRFRKNTGQTGHHTGTDRNTDPSGESQSERK